MNSNDRNYLEKVVEFFVSDEKEIQRKRTNRFILIPFFCLALLYLLYSDIYLLTNINQVTIYFSNSTNPSLEGPGIYIFGGFISAFLLILILLIAIFRLLKFMVTLINYLIKKKILEPLVSVWYWLIRQTKTSPIWIKSKHVSDLIYSAGVRLSLRYILFPSLKYLERESQPLEFQHFQLDVLPVISFSAEEISTVILPRYQRVINIILPVLTSFFLLIHLAFFTPLISFWGWVSGFLSDGVESLLFIMSFILYPVISFTVFSKFLNGCEFPVKFRAKAWFLKSWELQQERDLLAALSMVQGATNNNLQASIEQMRKVLEEETTKVNDMRSRREEIQSLLDKLANISEMSEAAKDIMAKLVDELLEQKAKREQVIFNQQNREGFRRDVLKDIIIALIFFILGLVFGK